MEAIPFSVNHFFQWKALILMETIAGSGSYSCSRKPFLLAKIIHFNGNHCPQWKLLLLVEATFFSGSHLLYQKLFVLVENALLNRNYSCQWKPLFLVETIGLYQYSFHLVETVPFDGDISFIASYSFYWNSSVLVKIIPFSGSHFRQWKPFLLGKAFVFRGNHCPFFFSGSCFF